MNQQPMEDEILERLDRLEFQVQRTAKMVHQIRQIFIWAGIISVAMIILPLIGLAFAIPSLLNSYSQISAMGF